MHPRHIRLTHPVNKQCVLLRRPARFRHAGHQARRRRLVRPALPWRPRLALRRCWSGTSLVSSDGLRRRARTRAAAAAAHGRPIGPDAARRPRRLRPGLRGRLRTRVRRRHHHQLLRVRPPCRDAGSDPQSHRRVAAAVDHSLGAPGKLHQAAAASGDRALCWRLQALG